MALDSASVIVPGTGQFLVAPLASGVPVAKPATPATPGGTWVVLGHTAYEDGFTLTPDGGEETVLRSWESPAGLQVSKAAITWTIAFKALQVDNLNATLYFGGGDVTGTDLFGVPKAPTVQNRSMYIRMIDGAKEFGVYLPIVGISADGEVTRDAEDFLTFPLKATVLDYASNSYLFQLAATQLGA